MNQEEMEKLKKINNYGYSSFEEYGAFDLVDTKAQVLCLLSHNNRYKITLILIQNNI